MPLAAARGREGARDPVRGVSTVLRDSGAGHGAQCGRGHRGRTPGRWRARPDDQTGQHHPGGRVVVEEHHAAVCLGLAFCSPACRLRISRVVAARGRRRAVFVALAFCGGLATVRAVANLRCR